MENYIEYFSKSDSLVNFLNELSNRGVKQAYIFNSFDENKNFNASLIFSMIINCGEKTKPCFNCPSCVKIKNLTNIDLFVYPKSNNAILVEDIEDIINTCYILPNELTYKVYILNNFENANITSQNKFLKTLEEPPQNVIFILNTTNLDKVLETIKSRCEIINLPSLKKDEFYKIFNRELNINVLENSNFELGNFLKLTSNNKFNEIFSFCLNLSKNMNSSKNVLYYSSEIIKDKINLEIYYLCLINIFRDLLAVKINKDFVINKDKINELQEISENFKPQALQNILSYLLKVNSELNFNTNENLIVDCLLLKIVEEKNKWNKK